MRFDKFSRKTLVPAAMLLALGATHAVAANSPLPADIAGHASGIWSIDPAGPLQRWIVIHNPDDMAENAVFHIEVLGRDAKAPAWNVKRLAPHMAITLGAILNSVRKPMQRGLVYPEQYEEGRSRWEKEHSAGQAKICTTSVYRCLKNQW